jgi:hypothetical protein
MTDLGFKYLPVDSEERLKFLEQLLVQGQLYFPAAAAFNDPGEFRIHFRPPKQKAPIRRQFFIDNPRATENEFERWYRSTSWSSWHVYFEPSLQGDLISQLGVLCLSRTCRDPIMWAHYAANHAGVCVAFNIGKLLDQIDDPIFGSVSYRRRLPVLRYFGEDGKQVITKLLLTKYKGWSYEKEVRIVVRQGNVTKQISADAIEGIILGKDVPAPKEAQIKKIVETLPRPIKVLRAHLSYATYELEVGISEYE